MAIERTKLPKGWHWDELGNLAAINPRRPALTRADSADTTFVPMPSVSESGRGILSAEVRPYGEVKKGYTYFEEGDVIFAKITPCMQNGKHAVARDLIGGLGFGSTEFHVIRPDVPATRGDEGAILADWVHLYLLHPAVLMSATASFTGAVGQQRVPPEFLRTLPIPVAPLPEQRRIIALLREQREIAEQARNAVQMQLDAANQYRNNSIRELFRDLRIVRSQRRPLADLCDLVNGDAYRASDWSSTGVPIIRIQNLNDSAKPFNYWNGPMQGRVVVHPGDVLLAWSGTPGTSFGAHRWSGAVGVLNQHIFRVDLDSDCLDPDWAVIAINERLEEMIGRAQGAVGLRHITKRETLGLMITVPDMSIQRELASTYRQDMSSIGALVQTLQKQNQMISSLARTLISEAFSGGVSDLYGAVSTQKA